MQEQIEKLKRDRNQLVADQKSSQTKFKTEIKRIDKAIRNFQRGVDELNGNAAISRSKTVEAVETILANGPLHLKQILARLNSLEPGKEYKYQSLSGLMQLYVKAKKKFLKVAPATFALIEPVAQIEGEVPIKQVVFYDEENTTADGGANV